MTSAESTRRFAENHDVYEKLYRRVYRRLLPLYRDIREITGYPE